MNRRPGPEEFAEYYGTYIGKVPDGPIVERLESQRLEAREFLAGISETRSQHRYAPEKWSIREAIGHVADSERMFAMRALAFARGDQGPFPSFDQDPYAATSNAHERPLAELAAELDAIRRATVLLFDSLTPEAWERRGVASGVEFTVRSLAWIIAGHLAHHSDVIRERYLAGAA